MPVLLLATAHRRSSRGLVGRRSWLLLVAFARPLASTSGTGFRKAGTVYAHRVSRASRPSVEMGACHRDCARQIRADDPLAASATGRKHPLGSPEVVVFAMLWWIFQYINYAQCSGLIECGDHVVIFRHVRCDIFQRELGLRLL